LKQEINENHQEEISEKKSYKPSYVYLWISFVVIIFDQITKYLIRSNLDYGEIIKVTQKFLWITYIRNTGAAFSLSFGDAGLNKIIFIIVSSIASAMLFFLIKKSQTKIETIAFSLILGGAIGNLIDRIFLGSVTDFIWCDFPDWIMQRWPVFNIADSSIVVAITILVIYTLFLEKKKVEDK
jgi:signal peptidase II